MSQRIWAVCRPGPSGFDSLIAGYYRAMDSVWVARVRNVLFQHHVVGEFVGGNMERGQSAGIGFWGFGSMLAITLSWSVNHSILWMILHGILSWFYVLYYAIRK